jgi:uncharacterized protein (DUF1697 family)
MPTYVAFLRAINVTGRFIKMTALAEAFHDLGYVDARTYINSGNVIFSSSGRSRPKLEQSLEHLLEPRLGFRSEAFVRTTTELKAIAIQALDLRQQLGPSGEVNVCFLQAALGPSDVKIVESLKSTSDDFVFGEREVYWLCLTRQSASKFSNAVLERKLKVRSTLRRWSMLSGLAAEL